MFGLHTTVHHNQFYEDVITPYREHTGYDLYQGKGYLQVSNYVPDDIIDFIYGRPIRVMRITIISGSTRHTNDILLNATQY